MVRAFLRDFKGYVQTDGYGGYNFLDDEKNIRHIGCLAHTRRGFMDVIKAQGKNRKIGAADEAMKYIKKLYSLERHARKNEFSVEEIYHMRQTESKPILEDFKKWLSKKSLQTPPKGLLGKAVSYTLNQWHRLIGYIEDGHLTPDNNMAENSIRPFVVGRKNWLFSGTPEGAEASALLYQIPCWFRNRVSFSKNQFAASSFNLEGTSAITLKCSITVDDVILISAISFREKIKR